MEYTDGHPFCIEDTETGNLIYLRGVTDGNMQKRITLTDYPTVSGKKLTDNAYVEPITFSFTLHTSHLISTKQQISNIDKENKQDLSLVELKSIIEKWANEHTRLNITTFEGYYPSMILNSIIVPEGNNLGAWEPQLSFREVKIANISTVKLDFPKTANDNAAEKQEEDLGSGIGSTIGTGIGGIAGGALVGAAVGSFFPGPGTVIGAAIGGVAGFFISMFA